MAKNKAPRTAPQKRAVTKPRKAQEANVSAQDVQPTTAGPSGTALDTLKENMKRIDKGNLFDALKRVKDMKSDEWRDPSAVRELTQNIAQDIGIKVDPKRIDAFMNAFNDVTKNAGDKGPSVNVEEIAKKYGGEHVDDKTIKEIRKFVK